ncbi:MAG: extracellular solute-binding protein [Roseitalea sp.]|jgi:iron(III) transport system substrate-binding protein|nr:extracellular solute-binding protein [Roseitalea sp.]MBO6742165.1 extracellular solute-binding protein [Roseitalea sp.]
MIAIIKLRSAPMPPVKTMTIALLATTMAVPAGTAAFAEGELNLYSSRHYDTDERLYSNFEEQTGITINRIEGNADELIARMEAEGANSPADVFLTVDTVRLSRAKALGLLQSVESDVLERNIPAYLQDDDNQWFGFSQRSRILFYDKEDVANPPQTYQDLANSEYEGMVCIRSSTNVYTQNIVAALISHLDQDAVQQWANGVVANFARAPQGGDTDQLRGIVSGECDIAMSNTYYFARAIRKPVDGLSDSLDSIGWVFPNQNDIGAHMNISGGGVAVNAPNRDNAVRFLEYLASEQAQEYFSAGNDEYPAVPGVGLSASVAELGIFRPDTINLADIADNIDGAIDVLVEAGWE